MVDWNGKVVTYADSLIGRPGSDMDEMKVKEEVLKLLGLMRKKPGDIKLREWRWLLSPVPSFTSDPSPIPPISLIPYSDDIPTSYPFSDSLTHCSVSVHP